LAASSLEAEATILHRSAPDSGLVERSAIDPNRANRQFALNDSRLRTPGSSAKETLVRMRRNASIATARKRRILDSCSEGGTTEQFPDDNPVYPREQRASQPADRS
jgi:hypothetical protein